MVAVDSEYTKQQLKEKESRYHHELQQRLKAETDRLRASGDVSIPSLSSLPLMPYLTPDGKVTSADVTPGVKASVYAIYDEGKTLQHVGVTRSIRQSLLLHLARMPQLTHYVKVHHILRPNRSLLELIKQSWLDESGNIPPGNRPPDQELWEHPLDIKPLMTDEDRERYAEKEQKGKGFNVYLEVARRYEAEKKEVLEARHVTEEVRFDPKLKRQGLSDLLIPKPKDEVPTGAPRQNKEVAAA
ncbi:unnamed protein product [Vitrella brassicaformis CCMP3155]|uniref:GIY-YIG domain-containing protein n=1 Tax=Vitrella brassicaformis (strain CCMP3155) TaxID=1169540 RepID=A0A0G4GGJ4_VITBC|nr:unnamed protein product [Vitrella brassicaformis CCMP3155]|eukprot:CEM28487.1 unnamed protein product [Vitrella brassicaformis CCMP3155]